MTKHELLIGASTIWVVMTAILVSLPSPRRPGAGGPPGGPGAGAPPAGGAPVSAPPGGGR